MWWTIGLIIYAVIGIVVAIMATDKDDTIFEFIICAMFMPIIVIPAAIFYFGPVWFYEEVLLRSFVGIKDSLKERFDPEERRWRKWKKNYYVRQEQERRSQETC